MFRGGGVYEIETSLRRRCDAAGPLHLTMAKASAVTWEFDFTLSRGNGFFEVDPTNFVIPASASQPTTFNVVAADVNITDAGGLFGLVRYTLDNVFQTSCTPAECSLHRPVAAHGQ
jgi:hypothetical protein